MILIEWDQKYKLIHGPFEFKGPALLTYIQNILFILLKSRAAKVNPV